MLKFIPAAGAMVVATTFLVSITPSVAQPWDFLDGRFGNHGDGSGSIEEHHDRFYYTGEHGVEGHPPHEVWIAPYSVFTPKDRAHKGNDAISAHVAWCSGHYRTYRPSDNSFRPQHGPRRACQSPYWH